MVARRRKKEKDTDGIKWPDIADQAALYPEQTHATGRAGFGVDDDEMGEAGRHYGAGAAGIGAGAYLAGRYNSTSSSHGPQPTLPAVPPSIYSSEDSPYHSGSTPYSPPQSSYGGNGTGNYSGGTSAHSHAPLAPGPASIQYSRAAGVGAGAAGLAAGGYDRNSPSPPRSGPTASSSDDHSGGGGLPLPGSAMGHEEIDRPSSPTPVQVGAFGPGYDESDGGKRWRLSVVNDDNRDD